MPEQIQIGINPRMEVETIKALDVNIMEQKHKGVKLDRCKLFRAVVERFNDEPDKTLKFLKIK